MGEKSFLPVYILYLSSKCSTILIVQHNIRSSLVLEEDWKSGQKEMQSENFCLLLNQIANLTDDNL